MEIGIVGAGYVGLVTAACLAELGNRVRCLDVDAARVERLRRGELPISEPDLDRLVGAGLATGRLTFHDRQDELVGADLVIVCVGTLDEAGEWTDRTVRAAVLGLAADPAVPRRIVIRSTLLPGTARSIAAAVREVDPAVAIAVSPEFTREGSAVADFLAPNRLVIGVDPAETPVGTTPFAAGDAHATIVAALEQVYAPLGAPILVTDLTSAELVKVGSNVFLAAKISYANEIARLALAAGANPYDVIEGIGLDQRIGRNFLSPGPGFGGSCLPSQARALPRIARAFGAETPVMDGIAGSNERQGDWVVGLAEAALGRPLAGAAVAVLGMTFKAGTDDLRESPAIRLARIVAERGAEVVVHDPVAAAAAARILTGSGALVRTAATAAEACTGADVAIVATEWSEYRDLDWAAVGPTMRTPVVVDARGIVDAAAAARGGIRVAGLARSHRAAPAPAARTGA